MVNPGQCMGGDGEATIAILDLDTLSVKKVVLDECE